MNEYMKVILSLSVSGSLLLLLLLGLKPLYRNRFSRRWQYYIWLIIALRFLLPFTFDTTIVGSLFERLDTAEMTDELSFQPDMAAGENTDNGDSRPASENGTVMAGAVHNPPGLSSGLFLIWAGLALVLLVRRMTLYQGFIRYIRAGAVEEPDIGVLNLLSDCAERLHIRTPVELYHHALIDSPVMIGFFRPAIVLPVGEPEKERLSYIFMHELIHHRRRDLLYKWLIQIVVCIHWFNPFVRLLEKEVNRACELACDEGVISLLDEKARHTYGDMLISFLKADSLCKSPPASLTLTEGAKQLKERLEAIMKFRKKSKAVSAVTILLSAAVCICFSATGAYAASPSVGHIRTWKDRNILNETLSENGVYYIFCDGAGEENRPQASVSAGSILFVVVRKDSFTSVGPFDSQETLMEDVTQQCEYMKSLTRQEREAILNTAAGICNTPKPSDSYTKLLSYKTPDYMQQSVAGFNASLASTPDELNELLAAQADVINAISPNDENYDFFTTTLQLSTNELYCEHVGEKHTFFASIFKNSRPGSEPDESGEITYKFRCSADLQITYSIPAPKVLTVAERDHTLLAFKDEMQNCLNNLSEAEITEGDIRTILTDQAAECAGRLSTENITLSCEISLIEISDAGVTDSIP